LQESEARDMFLLAFGEVDTDNNKTISKAEFLAYYLQVIKGLGCRM